MLIITSLNKHKLQLDKQSADFSINIDSHEKQKDIHESDVNHLQHAYDNACYLINKYSWDEINCTNNDVLRTIDDIHEEIYKKTLDILK